MLHSKARIALDESLVAGEEARLVIPGLASAAIIATDRRAFVFKAGVRAGLPFGARLKEFEYESVMRVDLRPAGEVDVAVIHAPLKISTCTSYWADPRDDPWRARNAIAVTGGSQLAARSVEELARLLSTFRDRGVARRQEYALKPEARDRQTPDVVGHMAEIEQRGSPEPSARCQECGGELGAGWQFCPRCGAPSKPRRRGGAGQQHRRRRPPDRGA
jgi:hypothetical protein